MGPIAFSYGLAVYGFFLSTFAYAIGFVGNLLVSKSIDLGAPAGSAGEPLAVSVLIDVLLLGVFALQHSVMARPAFKRWWTRFVPRPMERSTYVLLASSVLALLFWQWRPLGHAVWDVAGGVAGDLLTVIFWAGRLMPRLVATMRGSFHIVILPRKMSASTSGSSFIAPAGMPGRLKAGTMPPITDGNWPRPERASSVGGSGLSEEPKSTVPALIWAMPPPEPMDW